MAMIDFDEFLKNRPALHSWDGGITYNDGGITAETFLCIRDLLAQTPTRPPFVIETGAGATTIAFLLLGCSPVVTIAPDQALWDRIDQYLALNRIASTSLVRVVDYSEFALPRLCEQYRQRGQLADFGLIDGAHEYPAVFTDFCYINALLMEGGHLAIDDVQLHSPKELARFLSRSSDFVLVADLKKSLIFRKTTGRPLVGNFSSHRYLTEMTDQYARLPDPYALFDNG